jgi:hypothetical protein
MDYIAKDFYDRYSELDFLKNRYENLKKGEFGVIYGRRRMGKSVLLRRFIRKIKKNAIYIDIIYSNKKDFMRALSTKIEEAFKETIKIEEWPDFFNFITEKSKHDKVLLIIDEFQRIDSFSKDFTYFLQHSWDEQLKNNKIMLIICGSSMSMMHRIALEEKGPLYGRKTFSYPLKQFKYLDFREMFKDYSEEEKIKIFAVFGGTPKYLSDFKYLNKNLFEAFSYLVLSENGSLFDEPINALKFELKSPDRYISILRTISLGKVESKEIAESIGLENYEISPYLKNLIELLDIVEADDPLFGKKRMKRYQIKDNFFRFWYRFVYPYRELLNWGITDVITKRIEKEFDTYCGRIFEDIVKEFFIFMNKKKIKGRKIEFDECGKWWEETEDIDLVLKSKSKTVFIETRFRKEKVNSECFEELKRKSQKTSARGRFEYIIISKSGFSQELIDRKIPNLLLLNLDDLKNIMDEETKREVEIQADLKKWFDISS